MSALEQMDQAAASEEERSDRQSDSELKEASSSSEDEVGLSSPLPNKRHRADASTGGKYVRRGQFPHMALLGYGSDDKTEWNCAGSLIHKNIILTAAHCTSHRTLGPVTRVGLGMLKRSDHHRHWWIGEVSQIIPYPEYGAPSKYHDIALLVIGDRLEDIPDIRPACIGNAAAFDYGYDQAIVTSWGSTGWRMKNSDVMQQVTLQELDTSICVHLYPKHRHLQSGYNYPTQLCFGHYKEIRDTCEGDSGSPLQQHSLSQGCDYDIIGVTSFGHGCGTPGSASIFTRVSFYVEWINKEIEKIEMSRDVYIKENGF